jgi:hypothetical protein
MGYGEFIAHELAYETTSGLGIQAGVIPVAVPVPAVGPLAMLTVVAMGALGLRRKKP